MTAQRPPPASPIASPSAPTALWEVSLTTTASAGVRAAAETDACEPGPPHGSTWVEPSPSALTSASSGPPGIASGRSSGAVRRT